MPLHSLSLFAPAVIFIGRLVGLAIFHRRFLDAHFATSIYKCLLDQPVTLEDMALVDIEFFRSLSWMAQAPSSPPSFLSTLDES